VHEGSYASSGHYYVYIKEKGQWFKFNDERVERATREKALHYNYGGESDSIEFNTKEMKIKFKKHQNKATAYMLVYVSKDLFGELFEAKENMFPSWLIEKTKERKELEEEKKIRKQSICDLPVLRWGRNFLAQNVQGMGFISKEMLEDNE
jgi:ubiquitin carboxyl-terminal hydrolase 7